MYNGSNYLAEAIDSAIAQTYKNIEIIVINDGSNDNGKTDKIAKSYGNKIKYYHKENGGVATALNYGIEKMTGEYFSWLSHDDLYYPDKIEKQIGFLEKITKRNIVLFSNHSILKDGIIVPVLYNHEELNRKPKYSLLRGAVNGITVLVPKLIIDEVGKFDVTLRCTQDYDYWRRIQKRYPFIHMQDILSVTRIHNRQDSVTSPSVAREGNVLWIEMIKDITRKDKISYENTEYNFYNEMAKFLKGTPYKEAELYCEESLKKIKLESKSQLNKYKVSVIIPFYNRAVETLNSIKSVEAQTHKNIEIVLINDASTEDISSVLKYIEKMPNVKYINSIKNKGAASARNFGIRSSTGDFIAFLDSDDVFKKDKIEIQINQMLIHNPEISYTSYIKRSIENKDLEVKGNSISGLIIPNIISSCPIATPTVMINRKMLINEGILFNESMRIGEDTCFWLELAKKHEFHYIDKPLTIVNVNESSSAYDYNKSLIGFKNILGYLLNDTYYSNFTNEISLLANDFHSLNEKKIAIESNNLAINRYKTYSLASTMLKIIKKTIFFRSLRMIRRVGLVATFKLVIKKLFAI